MTTKPDITFDKANENAVAKTSLAANGQASRDIYPEINSRFKSVLMWLGLGFIVAVVLIQQFSGYN